MSRKLFCMKYLGLDDILRLFLIYWKFKRIINRIYDYKNISNSNI